MAQEARSGEAHPADTLGTSLVRATGVLSALSACQDASRGTFALNDQFLVQAVAALEGFVNDARNAYFDLCNSCDLSLNTPAAPRATAAEVRQPEPFELQEEQAIFVKEPQVTLPDLYSFRAAISGQEPAKVQIETRPTVDNVATTYEDLLRKLTAAEVFAAERGRAASEQSSPLLPLLKSLRQDLERFRAA